MQQTPPAAQSPLRMGCGELYEKATQRGSAQHAATHAPSGAPAASGCARRSPPLRITEGGSSVGGAQGAGEAAGAARASASEPAARAAAERSIRWEAPLG